MTATEDLIALAVLRDPSCLDEVTDPVYSMLLACEHAKVLLALTTEHAGCAEMAALKRQIEGLRDYVQARNLGRLALLATKEDLRRAERGLGLAIRRGQQRGEIETTHDTRMRSISTARNHHRQPPRPLRPRPCDYASNSELHSSSGNIFDLTDNVTDAAFEDAIATARAQGNLSRINVIRVARGLTLPKLERPEPLRGTHRWNSNRIVEQTVSLSGLDPDLAEAIDYPALDRDALKVWVSSLSGVIKSLTALRRNLKEELEKEPNRGQD